LCTQGELEVIFITFNLLFLIPVSFPERTTRWCWVI